MDSKTIAFFQFYEKREIKYRERTYNLYSRGIKFDIYSLSYLENNILIPLQKEGYSREYLDNLEITELLLIWLFLKDRNYFEAASNWFNDQLREIEYKAEKSEDGTLKNNYGQLLSQLEMEKIYFGVDLYEHITKQSSIKQLEAK